MKLILKAFWSATYLHVPAVLASEEAFLPWVEAALAILRRPVPEGQPEDAEARARWTWWKLKKWAMHFLGRALSRLCTPVSAAQEGEGKGQRLRAGAVGSGRVMLLRS